MLKKSASFVLAALRGSPYVKRVTIRLQEHCRLTVSPAPANVTLIILRVADLAAAALDGHFEHPTKLCLVMLDIQAGNLLTAQNRFFNSLLEFD